MPWSSHTSAFWGAAAALTSLSFVSSAAGAVVLLTYTVGLSAGIIPGYISNHLDLAPNFTGLLLGITNGLGSIGSILATLFAGFIVTDESNADQWMLVFYVCAAIFFFSNLIFLAFGTSDVLPWNDTIQRDTNENLLNQDVEKWGKEDLKQ
ncbi:putative inorganic phosphate cotransporter [Homalodisca vitripennis]|uniref:putative inorganic phosphate cotransporter n=1 Tax=Homalodisca vitripennis TaxID=197043 RepID=UPI001EECF272|nr:putative inorganic phosphate cotransporter [Homalodisca vitripennis]